MLFCKVRCRQPEKILFPPELAVFLAQAGQFSPFLAGELTLFRGAKVTAIDWSLPHPLSQAAVEQSELLGHSCAAEPLTEAELYGLLPLLRRKPAPGLGRVGHRWTV